MKKLALFGGDPILPDELPPYKSLSSDEEKAILSVLHSDCLSGFYGSWQKGFLGGPKVQSFEEAWSTKFDCKFSVSVNSNTTGLIAALGAIGLSPGDEVIVPPTTMSATAMAPIVYGGIPVFVDIEPDTFCLDVEKVQQNITTRTKAIIAVNLFGQPADLCRLKSLCDSQNIYLIEDNAQAMLAKQNQLYTGTIGDIGVFSLNYHKHIHTGEGGMCTTNSSKLAKRMQMIRNHAEAVVEQANEHDLTNMLGFNFRMTEMSAAIGLVQLQNIDSHVRKRTKFAEKLSEGISNLDGISAPAIREKSTHSFYNWMVKYDSSKVGVSRSKFVKALKAEGVPCFEGYVRPLYLLPIFQKRIAIGENGYPFNLSNRKYNKGLCPTAEKLFENEFIGIECCAYDYSTELTELIIDAFQKVHREKHQIIEAV